MSIRSRAVRALTIGSVVSLIAAPVLASCFANLHVDGCHCIGVDWPCKDDPDNDYCCPVVVEADLCFLTEAAPHGKTGVVNQPDCYCAYRWPEVVNGVCTYIPTTALTETRCPHEKIDQESPDC